MGCPAMMRPGQDKAMGGIVAKQTGPRLFALSRRHLAQVDEGYWQHMRFAGGVGWRMIAAGFACLLHALLPAIFTDRASRTIEGLHLVIRDRASAEAALRAIGPAPAPFVPLALLSLVNAALPWVAGAGALFALPLSFLSLAIPLAFLIAADEEDTQPGQTMARN
jgi:hypothetical protein